MSKALYTNRLLLIALIMSVIRLVWDYLEQNLEAKCFIVDSYRATSHNIVRRF